MLGYLYRLIVGRFKRRALGAGLMEPFLREAIDRVKEASKKDARLYFDAIVMENKIIEYLWRIDELKRCIKAETRMEILATATSDEIKALTWDGTGGHKPYVMQAYEGLHFWHEEARDLQESMDRMLSERYQCTKCKETKKVRVG